MSPEWASAPLADRDSAGMRGYLGRCYRRGAAGAPRLPHGAPGHAPRSHGGTTGANRARGS